MKSGKGWKSFTNSGQLPADVPANPRGVYRNDGWVSMGDWLGTGTIAPSLRDFRKFEDARLFARSLGLLDGRQWRDFAKSGKLPADIPANPNTTYKSKGWVGMGDWLGTDTVASYLRKYRTFERAREFARSLGLKSGNEWRNFTRSPTMPSDIPANPNSVYRDLGWIGMGDWLGTGRVASQLRRFRRFAAARSYARSLKLESHAEWRKHCKLGRLPQDIPSAPNRTYKNKGWGGWGDWLGTGTIAARLRKYLPFEEARKFSRALGLKTQDEWKIFCQSGNLPQGIPKAPQHTYAGKGWKGLRDWLGTEILRRNRSFVLPFDEAKRLVQELQLRSQTEWRAYVKKRRLPKGVPSNPNRTYKGDGWISFGDWLGTGTIAPRLRKYRPFEEAREFSRGLKLSSRKQWMALASAGRLPEDIPAKPDHVYRNRGWVGVRDWLGY